MSFAVLNPADVSAALVSLTTVGLTELGAPYPGVADPLTPPPYGVYAEWPSSAPRRTRRRTAAQYQTYRLSVYAAGSPTEGRREQALRLATAWASLLVNATWTVPGWTVSACYVESPVEVADEDTLDPIVGAARVTLTLLLHPA